MSRTRRFTMNLSEVELLMLRELAEELGVDQADILRPYIRERYESRFGRQPHGEHAGR